MRFNEITEIIIGLCCLVICASVLTIIGCLLYNGNALLWARVTFIALCIGLVTYFIERIADRWDD